jgi:hypothetical protein
LRRARRPTAAELGLSDTDAHVVRMQRAREARAARSAEATGGEAAGHAAASLGWGGDLASVLESGLVRGGGASLEAFGVVTAGPERLDEGHTAIPHCH